MVEIRFSPAADIAAMTPPHMPITPDMAPSAMIAANGGIEAAPKRPGLARRLLLFVQSFSQRLSSRSEKTVVIDEYDTAGYRVRRAADRARVAVKWNSRNMPGIPGTAEGQAQARAFFRKRAGLPVE